MTGTHDPAQPSALNDYLWGAYEKLVPPNASAPLAFIVRTRTEASAYQVAGALRRLECQVGEISRRRWPWGRRWQVIARSAPVRLDRAAIEEWRQRLTRSLEGADAVCTHWAPLLAGAQGGPVDGREETSRNGQIPH